MAKYTYLVAYNDACGTPEEVRRTVDGLPEILNWYQCLPHAYFVVSERTASYLNERLRSRWSTGRFIVLDMDTDRNGYLPKDAWSFISDPKPVGK